MGERQGDIRRNLGFSRDTLRLYEKQGIISPEIDPNNGYRSYDDWQVNLLWDAKLYQGLGFSLKEVRRIVQEGSLDEIHEMFDQRTEALEHELRRQQLVVESARRLEAEMSRVQEARARMAKGEAPSYSVERLGGQVMIAERKDHEFLKGLGSDELDFVDEYRGCLAATFYFPDCASGSYYWGFSADEKIYRELGGPEEGPYVFHLNGGEALSTYLDAGDRGGFNISVFEGLLAEAARRGARPAGPLAGRLICRTHEADGYHRFLHARLLLA
ncbi:MAG: MerR family transcriptional regulator [Tractidigestivibacter sp.]|jgi:DNA-binding transcriptional MerR regulator|uniref:MerR family transcriptional regulator n=1 Tax=Tractidigestivibacter sp. TaxID=2847320 RepID=UPI003D93E140